MTASAKHVTRHGQILREYFHFVVNVDWVALETPNQDIIPGYRTKRFGKAQDGCLYFTIGETKRGREIGLNDAFERIINSHGLQLKKTPASHGLEKEYVGVDLGCSDVELRSILDQVLREVK